MRRLLVIDRRARRCPGVGDACAGDARGQRDARSSSPASARTSSSSSSRVPRFTLAGVHWRGPGACPAPHALGRRDAGARGVPERPRTRTAPTGSPRRRGLLGWRIGNPWWVGESNGSRSEHVGPCGTAFALKLVWSPEMRIPYRRARRDRDADHRAAGGVGRERVDPARPADLRARRSSRDRPPHGWERTTTRARRRPRSSEGSSSTTSRGTAGTTSATTFSSTASERSTRGGSGASTATSSALTRSGFNTGSVGIALLGTYGDDEAVLGGTGRDRATHRLEARPRTRRPDRGRLASSRPAASGTRAALPVQLKAVVGPPRHGADGVPRQCALRSTPRDRGVRSGDRGPEGVRAVAPRQRVSACDSAPASRSRVRGPSLSPTRTGSRSLAAPAPAPSVDWTWDSSTVRRGDVHLDHHRGCRPSRRPAPCVRVAPRRRSRSRRQRPSLPGSRRTATGRPIPRW